MFFIFYRYLSKLEMWEPAINIFTIGWPVTFFYTFCVSTNYWCAWNWPSATVCPVSSQKTLFYCPAFGLWNVPKDIVHTFCAFLTKLMALPLIQKNPVLFYKKRLRNLFVMLLINHFTVALNFIVNICNTFYKFNLTVIQMLQ